MVKRKLALAVALVLMAAAVFSGGAAAGAPAGERISNIVEAIFEVEESPRRTPGVGGGALSPPADDPPPAEDLTPGLQGALEEAEPGKTITLSVPLAEDGGLRVSLPGDRLLELAEGGHELVIRGDEPHAPGFALPPEALLTEEVQKLLDQDPQLEIQIGGRRLSREEGQEIDNLTRTLGEERNLYRVGEDYYQLEASAGGQTLASFGRPISVNFPLPADYHPTRDDLNTIGVYRLVYDEAADTYSEEHVFTRPVFDEEAARWYLQGNLDRFSLFALFRYDKTFADIEGHWAQEEVELLVSRRVLAGISENEFAPEQTLTRAHFATMLVNAFGIEFHQPRAQLFTDVSPTAWYAGPVEAAFQAGLVRGVSEDRFEPHRPITREELAVMAARTMAWAGAGREQDTERVEGIIAGFADSGRISSWAREGAAAAVEAGIMTGMPGSRFAPREKSIRAQGAVVIYRLLKEAGVIL